MLVLLAGCDVGSVPADPTPVPLPTAQRDEADGEEDTRPDFCVNPMDGSFNAVVIVNDACVDISIETIEALFIAVNDQLLERQLPYPVAVFQIWHAGPDAGSEFERSAHGLASRYAKEWSPENPAPEVIVVFDEIPSDHAAGPIGVDFASFPVLEGYFDEFRTKGRLSGNAQMADLNPSALVVLVDWAKVQSQNEAYQLLGGHCLDRSQLAKWHCQPEWAGPFVVLHELLHFFGQDCCGKRDHLEWVAPTIDPNRPFICQLGRDLAVKLHRTELEYWQRAGMCQQTWAGMRESRVPAPAPN